MDALDGLIVVAVPRQLLGKPGGLVTVHSELQHDAVRRPEKHCNINLDRQEIAALQISLNTIMATDRCEPLRLTANKDVRIKIDKSLTGPAERPLSSLHVRFVTPDLTKPRNGRYGSFDLSHRTLMSFVKAPPPSRRFPDR